MVISVIDPVLSIKSGKIVGRFDCFPTIFPMGKGEGVTGTRRDSYWSNFKIAETHTEVQKIGPR
jgi:hypothetical protein